MKLLQLNEVKYTNTVELHKLERLLNAVAKAIPFIGYEAWIPEIQDELDAAFREVTGKDWHEWKK